MFSRLLFGFPKVFTLEDDEGMVILWTGTFDPLFDPFVYFEGLSGGVSSEMSTTSLGFGVDDFFFILMAELLLFCGFWVWFGCCCCCGLFWVLLLLFVFPLTLCWPEVLDLL